jgi:putative ABC transport system permease protein
VNRYTGRFGVHVIIEEIVGDLRYSVRALRKNRLLTASLVLTLALGIGANSLVFSVVRAVILRPLDYERPDELTQLWESGKGAELGIDWVSFPNFRDWQRQANSFTAMAAYTYSATTLSGDNDAESVVALETTDRLFDVLGAKPATGRTFLEGEDRPGREPVIVISYRLWQRRYAGDASVVGRNVDVNGRPHTIIGIMPSSFRFPNDLPGGGTLIPIDVWVAGSKRPDIEDRGSHNFWTVARLKSNVNLTEARTEMDAIAARLSREYPRHNKDTEISVAFLQDHVTGSVRPALLMLLGSVVLLLLLTCANVANLLLSRAESRRHEMAIREAIGAGRRRLIRQNLTESVLLAFFGALAGLSVLYVSFESLLKWTPVDIPRIREATIDLPVVLFTSAVALATGILFGLAPAISTATGNLHNALKKSSARASGDRRNAVVRHALIASQVALAVILLSGAGLLMRSLLNVTRLDPGFRASNLFMTIINLNDARYTNGTQQSAFFEELLRRVRDLPGVQSAAVSDSVPFSGINDQGSFSIEGRSNAELQKYSLYGPEANRPHVSTEYFETMGIPVVRGRTFDQQDTATGRRVAVISELAAQTYWPNEDPIGKRVSIDSDNGRPLWHEIVGIVRSTRHFGLEERQKPELYVPHTQSPSQFMLLVVRVQGDMESVINACRQEFASMDPQQGFAAQRIEDSLYGSQHRRRFQVFLVTGFATLATVLAAIGIYGVAAYSVTQRAKEISMRIALGARSADIVLLVLKQGTLPVILGAIAGIAGAAALSRVIANLLFGVSPSDINTFSVVLIFILAVGVASIYVPARRAAKLDPAAVLTEE